MKGRWKYPLKLAFFGLTPEYKQNLHKTIFVLIYKSGFDFDTLYNLPVHMRNFYLKEYTEWKKAENEQADNESEAQNAAYERYKQAGQIQSS